MAVVSVVAVEMTMPSSAFTTLLHRHSNNAYFPQGLHMSTKVEDIVNGIGANGNSSDSTIRVPVEYDELIADAAAAIKDAYEQRGITRQTIRILLPRDSSSGNLGVLYEEDADTDASYSSENVVLVPPDETWQGGIMQLYRAAAPTCVDILRKVIGSGDGSNQGGVPPRITEDRSIDESGVDGCGLLTMSPTTAISSSSSGSGGDDDATVAQPISCFVQPTQEVVSYGAMDKVCAGNDQQLVLMMNPQWRNIDDALDTASKETGLFGVIASFLGGKAGVLNKLENELGFVNDVYTVEGYVCKGGNIRLVKRFDTNWVIFAENDSMTNYIEVGQSISRPTYQDCDKMLDDRGISVKYARDIGLAPKFEK